MDCDYNAIRRRIEGPVYPVPPAFTPGGDLDLSAIEQYVAFLRSQGAKLIMVTAGTSRLNLLTREETALLNRTVALAAGPNVLTIGANPPYGSLADTAELTRQAMADGCGAMLIYYPERHYHDDYVFDYFKTLAEMTNAPLMIHAVPFANGRGGGSIPYSLDLFRRLAELDSVVGMKEELADENLRYSLAVHLGERIPLIVAGGSMRKHLSCVLFGVKSWLVGVGSFVPKVEIDYHEHLANGRHRKALDIVVQVEDPLFATAMPMGWHVAMRGLMDILKLMPGEERSPMVPATPEERHELEAVALKLGWLTR